MKDTKTESTISYDKKVNTEYFKIAYPYSTIKFKKVHEDAVIPTKKEGDACYDLYSVKTMAIDPGAWLIFPTGLKMEMPLFVEAIIRPRSGLAIKKGVTVLNTPGTIDSTYRGEVGVILINHSNIPVVIQAGDRIAQMGFRCVLGVTLVEVKELGETERDTGGFGSTGK